MDVARQHVGARLQVSLLALCCAVSARVGAAPPPAEGGAASLSVREFGARGDGVADDGAAFQSAFARAAQARCARVLVPAGTYRICGLVSVALDSSEGRGLSVCGEGQGVSVLIGAGTNGLLSVRDSFCKAQVSVKDLTLLAARAGAGVALEVVSPPRGARNYRTLTVENVDIRGEGLPTRRYFSAGVRAVGQWRPLFANVVFCGASDPALSGERGDASPLYAPEAAFAADWCYAPTFRDCYAWSAHTGYRVVSERLREEGPEDGAFCRCTANGVRLGIDVRTPAMEPQLVIEACHINARDVGIRLSKRKFFQITNCLLYGLDGGECLPYVDIQLSECYGGVIAGNIFHSPAVHNQKPEPAADRTMIRVDAASRDVIISDNIFNAKGVTVEADPQARNIEVRDNRRANPQAKDASGRSDAAPKRAAGSGG